MSWGYSSELFPNPPQWTRFSPLFFHQAGEYPRECLEPRWAGLLPALHRRTAAQCGPTLQTQQHHQQQQQQQQQPSWAGLQPSLRRRTVAQSGPIAIAIFGVGSTNLEGCSESLSMRQTSTPRTPTNTTTSTTATTTTIPVELDSSLALRVKLLNFFISTFTILSPLLQFYPLFYNFISSLTIYTYLLF